MCTLTVYFFEIINFFFSVCFCEAAESWQLGLQDPASPVFEGMIFFYKYLVFFLILTGSLIFWLLYITIAYFNTAGKVNKSEIFTRSSTLEGVRALFPKSALTRIATPSLFKNLYVMLFFITAAVCCLDTWTNCAPDIDGIVPLDNSTWFKFFRNFLEEGHSSLCKLLFSEGLRGLSIFVTVVVLVFVFVVGCYRTHNKKTTERLKRFQTFCCENQESIFLITVGLIFLVSLSKLTLCEVLIGSVIMGCGFLLCLISNQLKLPLLETYLFISFLTRVGSNTIPWDFLFGGLFLFYIYSLAVILFPELEIESTLSTLNSAQKNVTLHMRTEFKYFQSLEMFILLYWGFKLVSPTLFKVLLGEFDYLLVHFIHFSFLSCIIARVIATNLFNPFGDRKLNLIGTGAGIFGAVYSYRSHSMNVVDNAIGGTQEPAPGRETAEIQVSNLGFSSTTKEGLKFGKAFKEVYGGLPPLISGSTQINTQETLRLLQEETRPVYRQRIKGFLPDLVLVKPCASESSRTMIPKPLENYMPVPQKSKSGSFELDAMNRAFEEAQKAKKIEIAKKSRRASMFLEAMHAADEAKKSKKP